MTKYSCEHAQSIVDTPAVLLSSFQASKCEVSSRDTIVYLTMILLMENTEHWNIYELPTVPKIPPFTFIAQLSSLVSVTFNCTVQSKLRI